MALRNQYKELFEKKHGVKLGFMGFFVRACVAALKDIPAVNAEIDGTDLVYKNYYHIGVAVGTEKGLVVPVVRDCRSAVARRHREGDPRLRQARARRPAQDRGHAGRHLHDLERRRLRLADVDADPERAAVRHPRHAQDPGAAGGRRRQDRNPADDVSGAVLRSPHRRRPRGGDLPGAGEGQSGRSGARMPCLAITLADASVDGGVIYGLRPHRHRHRPRRLCLRHPRGAARPEDRRRREGHDLRRHLPQRRLHSVEGAAARLRTVRGGRPRLREDGHQGRRRRSSISPRC